VRGAEDHELRWGLFVEQSLKDWKFWLFAFGLLALLRVLILLIFAGGIGPRADWWEVLKCLSTGARFDASVAMYWALPCFVGTLLAVATRKRSLAETTRAVVATLFVVATTLIGAVAIGFFAEYKDHFNHWILGVVFDDMRAVLRTVWKGYPVIPAVFGMAVVCVALVRLWKWLCEIGRIGPERAAGLVRSVSGRGILVLSMVAIVVVAVRGSVGRRPVQLKDAAVTKDRVLNKLVLNPYSALKYAISQQLEVIRGRNLQVLWPSGDIRDAAKAAFPSAADGVDLDSMTMRVAHGPPGKRPKHVFLVVLESYDAWPLLDRYRSLELTEGVRSLAREGVLIPAFVPAGAGTMISVSALITGLPYSGLVVNYEPTCRTPLPTSIAPVFKRLGYRTRAFYAGYLSWQRFGDFCLEQGFDEVHGGGDIDESGLLKREWGVEDDKLFNYVLGKVSDDPPSFNLILSAGYHPPYSTDVFGRGYGVRQPPPDLKPICSRNLDFKVLGHLWFADHSFSSFVLEAEKRLGSTLFAATGDHWSRRFVNERPNAYERTAVLMLWRGRGVLPGGLNANRLAGSHTDILPTMIELVAQRGFEYHAFGRNMFDLAGPQIGFGSQAIVTPDWFLDPTEPDSVLGLQDMRDRPATPAESAAVRQWQALRALSWWRVVNGPDLAAQKMK